MWLTGSLNWVWGDCFNYGMLGRDLEVIIGWIGLEQEALCGNGKIPPGSLGLRLISSSILLVGLEGECMGMASLWLREGYGGCLLFWYGGRFNSKRGMVDLLWPEVDLWGISLMVPVL